MKSQLVFPVSSATLLWLCCSLCHCSPLFYNISVDGSGDEPELELIFPTSFSTRAPAEVSAATSPPSLTNTITTTMIRLKDFVLSRVVDFLQENLLIIIVVTSLLIVLVFIICCAFAMSHKRKLEAYKPLPSKTKKYTASKTGARKNSSEIQEKPYAVDHVKRVHVQGPASPKHLRMPSKALVGEKGREVRSSPRPEVRKVRDTEEVEKRREEVKFKEPVKQREEVQKSASPSTSSSHPVCTCHLKKSNH
ncbi:transmembrane protein 119 [Xiphophorus hellerii]|uniref:transmembrane protein 119 n=1 Tax=Xiphophorus hellerii TaxID=8084 RepID=UPI0013B46F27|nr:transmembrane protein 119 [Xiphophorus hellerii]XP_032435117.1 transmembrane protein 119 [Xiphophorus hellerii]